MNQTPEIFQFFGRLHTVALHFPIGFLIFAFMLEVGSRFATFEKLKPAVPFTLFWGMIAAVFTAIFGYLLSWEGGYEENLLWNHQWLGITTAGLSIALYFLRNKKKIYLPLFLGLMGLIFFTGHSGGSITHGSNFLMEPFEEQEQEIVFTGNIEEVKVFSQLIRPILKSKCFACHNTGKIKGGLVLTDTTSIKNGGDNGALFLAHQPEKSLLIQRLDLPLEIEEHMPPKGKKQLSDEEQKLLRWWISGEAEFVKTVAKYPEEEAISAILKNKFIKKKSGFETINISPASRSKIAAIKNQGLNVNTLSVDNPWLEARLSDRKELNAADFKQLKKVAENITILDLGNTPFDDELTQHINAFPNISKLFLDQTQISDTGFKKIKALHHLEYLNLYGCDISDASISQFPQFKNLKTLHLWQTKISDQGIKKLKKMMPKLMITTGKEHSNTFATAQLRAPKIQADSSIFMNELEVALKLNFPWAKVYYTTDGTTPDSNDFRYEKPFVISSSTTVKTIAIADNWEPSEIAEETFFSIQKRPKNISITQKPNDSYKGEGAKTLTDLKLGSSDFKDGNWLGWQGKSLTATLDFEKEVEVSSLFISCLDNNGSWIFFPKQIKVWTSTDGKQFNLVATEKLGDPSEQQIPSIQKIKTSFEQTTARYVKVFIENRGKNPSWHPAPGQPSWLFVDEIIVE